LIALLRQRSHHGRMSKRATKRPEGFTKPKHWDDTPPPKPEAVKKGEKDPQGLSPTRYGDWVKDGIAIDF
jgi:hypothetical protein